ncbi:hypothetical protein [Burkholderia guangdongensis]|uniref:hypothetical protein n=1 Tax=Burkholderia guangdongensis TaxID=1792500 RepID=UPI0015CC4FD8|nr:hypothetical protein [Burkholderia guangdongensis]
MTFLMSDAHTTSRISGQAMNGIDANALSTLIHLVYVVAWAPTKWRVFLDRFATAAGAEGSVLFTHDFCDSSVVLDDAAPMEYMRFDPAFSEREPRVGTGL